MSYEFLIAGRYLRAKRRQTFISLITILSILGVTVGVMALIVVIAVMSGFENDLKSRILGVEAHIVVMRFGGDFTEHESVRKRIEEIPGVAAATPFVYTQAMLRSAHRMSGAVIRGMDPKTAGRVIRFLDAERLARDHASYKNGIVPMPGVILGKELAKRLGVGPGDEIQTISPRGMISPIGHLPSMKRFRMISIFESGMYEYDGSLAYLHIQDAQKLLRMGDAVTGIEVRVHDIYAAGKISQRIRERLGLAYSVREWREMNQNLFSALKLEKTAMFIILTLIVLVAAFNIASSLIMMVMEKTRDIAILKAMGATDGGIRKIFVFQGMAVGAIGTFCGVAYGVLICTLLKEYQFIDLPGDVYPIEKLPVLLNPTDVLIIASASLLICFLSTLYPSRQAAQMNPVEALRYG